MAADLSHYLVVVLAAGLGKRLNPLTQFLPKPVIPLLGEPLCLGMIKQLFAHSARTIHVNTSYLAGALEAELKACLGTDSSMPSARGIRFWHEQERLETGGAILRIWGDLKRENSPDSRGLRGIFVVSGDLVGQIPITEMLSAWETRRNSPEGRRPPSALLAVHHKNGIESKGVRVCSKTSEVLGFWEGGTSTDDAQDAEFAGYQIIAPEALEALGKGVQPGSSIDLIFRRLLAQNSRIDALELSVDCVWHNVGTPKELSACRKDLSDKGSNPGFWEAIGRHPKDGLYWSGECMALSPDYAGLITLTKTPIQRLQTPTLRIARNEFEFEETGSCLVRCLEAVKELSSRGTRDADYASEGTQALRDYWQKRKDLPDQVIMQVFVAERSLLPFPRPLLVGGGHFLELALSQRGSREGSLDWLSLLISHQDFEASASTD